MSATERLIGNATSLIFGAALLGFLVEWVLNYMI